MISKQKQLIRFGAALLATVFVGEVAGAQSQAVQSYKVGRPGTPSYRESPSDALARNLRGLAESPRNVGLLIGAGNAALEMGDPQAALTFFARAEHEAPRDGRIKAGMGSAFVLTEQPHAAIKFFSDAVALGVPEHLVAKDRGLAHDMLGDQARAQADYAAVLQRGSDAETERRMALSLAISGNRDRALAMLEPHVRRHDQAAWRARAFVLALTGDAAGAVQAVDAVMPGQQAAALRPFLAQLPQLNASQRAMAVHFGRFPHASQIAANQTAPAPPPVTAPAPSRTGDTRRRQSARTQSGPPRQAPPQPVHEAKPDVAVSDIAKPPPAVDIRAPLRVRMADAAARERAYQQALEEARREAAAASSQSAPAAAAPAPRSDPQPAQPQPQPPPPERMALAQPIQTASLDASAAALDGPAPVPVTEAPPASGFADIVATISALPAEAEAPPARKPAPKPAKPSPPPQPSRIWVQIAAAQDASAFPAEFRRIQRKAPELLSDKTAWTAPFRSTNRLLVGPFRTEKEARDLVNDLAKMNVDSFSWTSAAGQEIAKLPAR